LKFSRDKSIREILIHRLVSLPKISIRSLQWRYDFGYEVSCIIERICFRATKILVDLVTGAQSENLLRILWHEIPQCVILRCEKWERCERDINHMCKINASYITQIRPCPIAITKTSSSDDKEWQLPADYSQELECIQKG
jgi:hypothetical protein